MHLELARAVEPRRSALCVSWIHWRSTATRRTSALPAYRLPIEAAAVHW